MGQSNSIQFNTVDDVDRYIETGAIQTNREIESLTVLADLLERVADVSICRDDAATLYAHSEDNLAEVMPLSGFTIEPTKINLEFATEGIASAIAGGIAAALSAIWKVLRAVLSFATAPIRWIFGDSEGSGGVSSLKSRIDADSARLSTMNVREDKLEELEERIIEGWSNGNLHFDLLTKLPALDGLVSGLEKSYTGIIWNASEIISLSKDLPENRVTDLFNRAYLLAKLSSDIVIDPPMQLADTLKKLNITVNTPNWGIPDGTDMSEMLKLMTKTDYVAGKNQMQALNQAAMDAILTDETYKDVHGELALAMTGERSNERMDTIVDAITKFGHHIVKKINDINDLAKQKYEGDVTKDLNVILDINSANVKNYSKAFTEIGKSASARWHELGLSQYSEVYNDNIIMETAKAWYKIAKRMNADDDGSASLGLSTKQIEEAESELHWWNFKDRLGYAVRTSYKATAKWIKENPEAASAITPDPNKALAEWRMSLNNITAGIGRNADATGLFIRLYTREVAALARLFNTVGKLVNDYNVQRARMIYGLVGMSTYRVDIADRWISGLKEVGIKVTDEDSVAIHNDTIKTSLGKFFVPTTVIRLLKNNKVTKDFNAKFYKEVTELLTADIVSVRGVLLKQQEDKVDDATTEQYIRTRIHSFVE